jgi:hypothetical protein
VRGLFHALRVQVRRPDRWRKRVLEKHSPHDTIGRCRRPSAAESPMNQITSEQWSQMGRDSFDARLLAVIRRNHPEQAAGMDVASLVDAFRRQSTKAHHYGLTDEFSAATYVYTAWLMGEEFDTRIPAIAQLLADKRMKAPEKAKALGNFSRLVFRTLSGDAGNTASRNAA